jgi:type IV pilus assembly protein PilV
MQLMKNTLPKQRGFSLLEALITMLIISLGLLGIAGIIANSLKVNQGAYYRSQASWMANDIIDRMRANRNAAQANPSPYNLALGATPSGDGVPLSDLTEWRAALQSLPSGTGSVAVDAATNKVTVTVQWDDTRAAGGEDDQQFVVETRL